MGEIIHDSDTVFSYLITLGNSAEDSRLYADAFTEYREAMRNIRANGAVVVNPRTNAPLDNPYLKIRDRAAARLQKMTERGLEVGNLWGESANSADFIEGDHSQ